MSSTPARYGFPNPADPVAHDMPSIRYAGEDIAVRLEIRRAEDGAWRGRLLFASPDATSRSTAEIFFASNEADLWQSVREVGIHHVRDLYRSLL